MPVIKSAKKKLRQDKKRTVERAKQEEAVRDAIKKATATPSEKTLKEAVSLIDKAAKKHIIHKNKAARIKSKLSHLLKPKGTVKKEVSVKETPVKAAKKTITKKATAKKTSTKKR